MNDPVVTEGTGWADRAVAAAARRKAVFRVFTRWQWTLTPCYAMVMRVFGCQESY